MKYMSGSVKGIIPRKNTGRRWRLPYQRVTSRRAALVESGVKKETLLRKKISFDQEVERRERNTFCTRRFRSLKKKARPRKERNVERVRERKRTLPLKRFFKEREGYVAKGERHSC